MKCKVCPLIVSLIVLWASSCNSKVFYDYERYGLNCPVKSVKVTTYKAESKFGDIVKDVLAWDGHYLVKFNTIGNLEEISWFDHEGTLYSVDQYKYNDNNKIVEIASYNYEGALEYRVIYEYVDDKIRSYISTSFWNNIERKRTFNHKWDGEYIIETDELVNGELESKTKYTNPCKNSREWVEYDKDGKEVLRGYEEYDDCRRIIKRNEGDLHIEVQWNEKNLPTHLKNARLYMNTIISWSDSGNDGEYYVEYEYDKKGNWIKQIVYEGKIKNPQTISERIITY